MSPAVGKFGAGVATRQVSRWEFRLLEPLIFNDPVNGLRTVPTGFVSNLASIRILRSICQWAAGVAAVAAVLLWGWLSTVCLISSVAALALYAIVVGYGMRASILHDWEYTEGTLPRVACDAMYERASNTGDGEAKWRSRGLFWPAVRIFGKSHYTKTPTSSGFSSTGEQ
ncbi:hypothetical protein QN382_23340 [Pseudomonas sp. 10B1]|uniref:hypothetical protein n=1 Tax=unclassified Pseudomonas TaxID=196821 RepID=UPI002B236D3D|nr:MULTISPECIES: hypothetical protein [unclassified Pseudomonas]MEA9997038.1 hypothetical protein [Pseudomonas sp. AA4]MEB0089228.1 hypothetical protein [Pseudomonas sp. RTI1]MEB0128420.1 hypothetical protein [Pseudomonas sp. CCC1.2]MEB0155318.1 hypothetical protein [Pseudomonas sp. CCC4.3]MEB0221686.1 hypothetical protein [Pseudomonas sp. AB12(2023)]